MTKHLDQSISKLTRAAIVAIVAGGTLTTSLVAQDKEKDAKGRDPRSAGMTPARTTQPKSQPGTVTNPITGAPKVEQPGATGAGIVPPPLDGVPMALPDDRPPPPEGTYRFPAFSEPVDVTLLIDMVADRLKIQLIATDIALREKKINLRTPIDVKQDDLLGFLSILLEQVGQYISKEGDIYFIKPSNEAGLAVGDKLASTQVIPTKGIRPTSLTVAVNNLLRTGGMSGGGGGQPGGVPGNQVAGSINVTYLDDLGIVVMTDTPRRIEAVRSLIDQIAMEQIDMPFTRYEVKNLSANVAKQRMLEMIGTLQQRNTAVNQQNFNNGDPNNGQPINMQPGGSSSNLANRLFVDPQANAIVLRGRPEEATLIKRLLEAVDVPNQLMPKWYAVGPAAQALAEQGKRAGLGDVTTMQSTRGTSATQNPGFPGAFSYDNNGNPIPFGQHNQNQTASGPVFVLDGDQRGFIYYGTPEQHAQLDKLVKEFDELTKAERVVYEFYKLKYADAEKTAEIIRGMINNTVPGGEAPLIPGAGGAGANGRRNSVGASMVFTNPDGSITTVSDGVGGGGGLDQIIATEDVHVLPDKSNNQIVVKAPQRMQAQFQRLIDKVDQRRAQVYIDAKIVVVSNKDDLTVAIETQLAETGRVASALRTSFGLSTLPTTITGQPLLATPLASVGSGLTAAVIKSEYVPFIINAVQTVTDGRIIASPQLLVDDNEEAELSSINEEPTTTTNIGTNGQPNTTTFNGYQEAGPKLKVKPRISSGDFLSIEYSVELSSFTGTGSGGVPPARQTSKVSSKSISIPSDSTIIVGGLTLKDARKTVVKVPFFGDIPVLGELMKKTGDIQDERTVYILITPRIMRDPVGNDLRLFSRGPAQSVRVNTDLPPVFAEPIIISEPGAMPAAPEPIVPKPSPDFVPPNQTRPVQ